MYIEVMKVTTSFKTGALVNAKGTYDNLPTTQQNQNLAIKRLYPLIKK
jgi:hypothetical protein